MPTATNHPAPAPVRCPGSSPGSSPGNAFDSAPENTPASDAGSVCAEPAAPARREKPQAAGTAPKILPPYQVVILNDDDHTYEYVIRLLIKVFRLELKKALLLTRKIDKHGRAAVWSGTKELAELKQQQVRTFGPDIYATATVTYPLGCVIEPLPQ